MPKTKKQEKPVEVSHKKKEAQEVKSEPKVNKFGHKFGTKRDIMDKMFLKGATLKAAATKVNITEARAMGHLRHLEVDRKRKISITGEGKTKLYKVA